MNQTRKKEYTYQKIIRSFLVICIMFSLASNNALAYSDVGAVAIPSVKQTKSNWCWAACGESILRYYGKSVTQASFVAYVKNSSSAPNVVATDAEVKAGLRHWGVTGTLVASSISFSTVSSNIRSGKPIYAGWSWSNGGGHAIVINGYDGTNSSNGYIEYMDPATGEFYYLSYNAFKGGASYNHIWDGTIYALKVS